MELGSNGCCKKCDELRLDGNRTSDYCEECLIEVGKLDARVEMLEKLEIVKELYKAWGDFGWCMDRCQDELGVGGPFVNHQRFETLKKASKKFFALEKKYAYFIELSNIPHD